jgi:diadenosine tetraphosphatase ApaH/serine/threonine PP2A family protein phosphatase
VSSIFRFFVRPGCVRFISADDAIQIVAAASEVFSREPAVLELCSDFCIVGDIHGSLDSVLRVFSRLDWPPDRSYLFLCDYVDRGEHSTEVIMLLYSLKLLFSRRVYLLRGNHECRSLTTLYGFKLECTQMLGEKVYDDLVSSFDQLPIAAVLNGATFCVHGRFSPALGSRDDVVRLAKPVEDPVGGVAGDLLWSDFEAYVDDYEENVNRGCGFVFGAKDTRHFLEKCRFVRIVRSHQSVDTGFCWDFGDNGGCLTVFSAVDYMGRVNDGGVAVVDQAGGVDTVVFRPLMGAMKSKVRLICPAWVMENAPLKRTVSEPLARGADAPGMEVRTE